MHLLSLFNRPFIIIMLCLQLFTLSASATEDTQWSKTISTVSQSVVSIRFNTVVSFDTQRYGIGQATGFVVDAKRGIILSNRHVVQPGPITAEAVFYNNETIEIHAIYRDPVHDFGFFQYDPKKLHFTDPRALPLAPNAAQLGQAIKIIGNDAGEHMSILSGILARIDRNAPLYEKGNYRDFNTFYFQSSADTAGGSSGSPVIDIDGQVLALNAGGASRSSSSYFLPLYKVVLALNAIQAGQPIHRGTIETIFRHQSYDDVARLGLTRVTQQLFRQTNKSNGLLVVHQALPGGPGYGLLKPGDILISAATADNAINTLSRFETLDIFLDENVGKSIRLEVERQGQRHHFNMIVGNLHAITPDEYVEIGGGVFNNLSYQLALQINTPISGVYVSAMSFMETNNFLDQKSIIHAIDGQTISNLDDLVTVFKKLKQGQSFTVTYTTFGSPLDVKTVNLTFETRWHRANRCKYATNNHDWQCTTLALSLKTIEPKPTKVTPDAYTNKLTSQLARSLVRVDGSIPYLTDGHGFKRSRGTGLVVDAKNGLIAVSRSVAPVNMMDVKITLGTSVTIPGQVIYVHPLHHFALIQYDTKLLNENAMTTAKLSTEPLQSGDDIWLVGYKKGDHLVNEKHKVNTISSLELSKSGVPQFRDHNIEAITIDNPPDGIGAVLVDSQANVRAYWTIFTPENFSKLLSHGTLDRGLPIRIIHDMIQQWQCCQRINVFSLDTEFKPQSIHKVRKDGLPTQWIEKYQQSTDKPRLLKVIKTAVKKENNQASLAVGDLLLAINGKLITSFLELEQAVSNEELVLTLWRDRKEQSIVVKPQELTDQSHTEIFLWAGATLQSPHRALATQYNVQQIGVYVASYAKGSPSHRYALYPRRRIVEFEGHAITNLQQFIKLTQRYNKKLFVQIRLLNMDNQESLITLKPDYRFWPTQRIFWDNDHWQNEKTE
jgi:S1-C subfamily serine protease